MSKDIYITDKCRCGRRGPGVVVMATDIKGDESHSSPVFICKKCRDVNVGVSEQ